MSEAMEALARALRPSAPVDGGLVLGKVTAGGKKQPLKILAEGIVHQRDSLLRNDRIGPVELEAGDEVVLWPIEDHQRYVILARVVSA